MDNSAAEIVLSTDQDMGGISLPSRPMYQLGCHGPIENSIPPLFQREQQCVDHSMQFGPSSSFDRFYVQGC